MEQLTTRRAKGCDQKRGNSSPANIDLMTQFHVQSWETIWKTNHVWAGDWYTIGIISYLLFSTGGWGKGKQPPLLIHQPMGLWDIKHPGALRSHHGYSSKLGDPGAHGKARSRSRSPPKTDTNIIKPAEQRRLADPTQHKIRNISDVTKSHKGPRH